MSTADDSIEASVEVSASCERIFQTYTAVSRWPEWDPDLEEAGIHGDFQTGTRGWIKPRGAPRLKTRLVEVVPGRSFTAESKVPGCTLIFHHQLESLTPQIESAAGSDSERTTRVTHSVEFRGALSGLISKVVGPRIRDAFPGAMNGLKSAAESHGDEDESLGEGEHKA